MIVHIYHGAVLPFDKLRDKFRVRTPCDVAASATLGGIRVDVLEATAMGAMPALFGGCRLA